MITKTINRRGLLGAGAALAVTLGSAGAALAEYPERPISMIVAASPGGGTDVMARTIVPFMEKYLGDGASITVINKPGAGTEIGATTLAEAKPDGYTIGMINLPHMIAIPIERKAAFHMLESFEPLANLVTDAAAFNVSADSEFETLDDLITYAKENPGTLTVGTSGVGGDDHLAMLMFEKAAGIEFTHVPYNSGGPVRAAVLGGHIDIGSFNVSEAVDFVNEGQLRTLGIMSDERWEEAPDIATFAEQGFDVAIAAHRGMAAPKGVPEDILGKLRTSIEKTMADPEFQAAAKQQKLPLRYMPHDEYLVLLQRMDADMKDLWAEDPWKE
ncbi:tripartite tricarboxylate transporter substrate binding protein [Acuticoccus kandeliae]|uniref:tripartite tricarboxylate transporter substrate binding protein n=1 Tax=Acuticoccus kandeliae TaxID=2073160 RepID=UPI000D3E7138|nr:tripartite tricarboxylate transporter substrate binding protein [Acuticoccus kandeliae]